MGREGIRRRRKARTPVYKEEKSSWRDKLHPFFIRMAEMNKNIFELSASSSQQDRDEAERLKRNPPQELFDEAERLHDEFERDGKFKYNAVGRMLGLGEVAPGSTISLDQFMLARFAFFKYGKTIPELLAERNAGSWKASQQLLGVQHDYEAWAFGKLNVDEQQFKLDVDHFLIVVGGLNLGIEALTPGELADCLDELCPCGKPHYPENVRKLRIRILKWLEQNKSA
jgi:hypothetical protein